MKKAWFAPLALLALAALVHGWGLGYGFSPIDDAGHIWDNPLVRGGLTWAGAREAFSTTRHGWWMPLTWLSLMLDAQVFGLRPAGFHLTNIALHLLNGVLLWRVVRSLTGCSGRSFLVAALFAVHPLLVEPVAWATARKDVLFLFFTLLSLQAYVGFVRRRSPRRYLLLLLLFLCGAAAKPMAALAPLLMLLLDWWPLGRWLPPSAAGGGAGARTRLLLLEKAPLVLAAAAVGVMALSSQVSDSRIAADALAARLGGAAVGYLWYPAKVLWPASFAPYYFEEGHVFPVAVSVVATCALLALTAFALRGVRRFPGIAAGWFWYLLTVTPVVGFVKAGNQFLPDRLAYLPAIGLVLAAVWAGAGIAGRLDPGRRLGIAAAALAVTVCALLGVRQVALWRDPVTLFRHAVRTAPTAIAPQVILGSALAEAGQSGEAEAILRGVLARHPSSVEALRTLGLLLIKEGRSAEAVELLLAADELHPQHPARTDLVRVAILLDLGLALRRTGRAAEACRRYAEAISASPPQAALLGAWGICLAEEGRGAAAAAVLRRSLELDPTREKLQYSLGKVLAAAGDRVGAEAHLRRALALDPELGEAQNELGALLAGEGRLDEAESLFRGALAKEPGSEPARMNLGRLLVLRNREEEALMHFEATLAANPANGDAAAAASAIRSRLSAAPP